MTSSLNREVSDAFTPELLPFEDCTIRQVTINNKRWLIAADIVQALKLQRRNNGIRTNLAVLSDDQVSFQPVRSGNGIYSMLCVTEDGLSRLASSMTRQANAFAQWVAERGAQSPIAPGRPVSTARPSAFQRLAKWVNAPTGSPVTA